MDQIVVFTENNARIIYTENPNAFSGNILVNPEIPVGIPPHYWKPVDGRIEVMSEDEKHARDAHIAKYGAINDFPRIKSEFVETITDPEAAKKTLHLLEWFIISMIVIMFIIGILKIRHG